MSMIKNFLDWLNPQKRMINEEAEMTVRFLKMLEMTQEEELSCEEIHEMLDQFVDLKLRGVDVAEMMPLVKHHLDLCRDCIEEYEALLVALEVETTL